MGWITIKTMASICLSDFLFWIGSLSCDHEYQFMGNLHHDLDIALPDRSWWRCPHCRKTKNEDRPYHKDPKTKLVYPMSPEDQAYQHGYMRELLKSGRVMKYDPYPKLLESYNLGHQIAQWDEEDRDSKDGARYPI
jgi:hypothetical protein